MKQIMSHNVGCDVIYPITFPAALGVDLTINFAEHGYAIWYVVPSSLLVHPHLL
jgi:hypothetical protein